MKHLILTTIIVLSAFGVALGQNGGNERAADSNLRGGGRVNASTLGMEFSLPLANYPGRGINVPISLSYSSKLWRMKSWGYHPLLGGNWSTCYPFYFVDYAENTNAGWTTSLAVPRVEFVGMSDLYVNTGTPYVDGEVNCPTSQGGGTPPPTYWIRRILIHMPSGETHELRPDDTAIQTPASGNTGTSPHNWANWNTTYYAVDSSNLKYVQDASTNTRKLLMPDGSYYDFINSSDLANTFTDRNGNQTVYYPPGSVDSDNVTHPNGYWKDTLNRNIPIFGPPTAPTTSTSPQIYSVPGMTGSYKMQWKLLNGGTQAESALTDINGSGYQLRYLGETYSCGNEYCNRAAGTYLFTGAGTEDGRLFGDSLFNPMVLTEVELPTGLKYKFTYDIYGRIERIYYPTGGEEHFTYSVVPTLSVLGYTDVTGQTNFGVTERKVYESSNDTTPYIWTYSGTHVTPSGYKVTTNNPDGTHTERFLHRGNDDCNGCGVGTFGYDNGLAGMPYEERGYDSSSTPKLLSKKLTNWTLTTTQMIIQPIEGNGYAGPSYGRMHPRVESEESILYDNSGNGVSTTTTFDYAGDLSYRNVPVLQNKASQYAFVAAGSSLPSSPVRTTESTFLIYDSAYSGSVNNYTTQNMIGLVTISKVKNGSGIIVSQSETVYDQSGRSPGYRGNPTSSRAWDSSQGLVTDPDNFIATHAKFDSYGNQYESTDALGNTTTTVFDGTYNAFPVLVTSPVPSDGTYGSNTAFVTSMTYDYTSGLPLTMTDANGQTSTIEYNDPLLRPTRTIAPNGHQTITEYGAGTSEATRWVKVKSQIDNANWKEAISWFDGLGRTYKSQSVDTNGDVFALTCFDSFGRPSKTSNPFRNVANATCSTTSGIDWTTSTYDTASRPWKITTPDNAVVETNYGLATTGANIGTVVTVNDQALKQRRSVTNALGQLTRVDEPDDNSPIGTLGSISSPNQPTNYSYDTLNNLTTVNQGVQTRSFVYDSMSRLKSATNPESGLIQYAYDNNSNLTAKTDARLVVTNYMYDALNRVKNRNYTAPTGLPNYQPTPNVSYFYDGVNVEGGIANSKGKLTKVSSSVSTTEYMSFDILGRVTGHKQTTDGGDSVGYATSYVYNLSGAMIEETYPSGRVVKNVLDNDGDLSIVQSKKNANFGFSSYAKSFTYTSAGAVSSVQLGNGKWESSQFNSRLQVTQIALGTVQSGTDKLKLNYSYGDWNGTSIDPTKNNGNIVQQIITVPTAGSSTGFTATQKYYYDSLNRIDDSTETISTTQTWRQDFTFDRYGNRRFNETNTSMPASFSNQALTNPTISTSNNQLTSTGWTYDASGNTKGDPQSRHFTYDGENKQVEVKNSSSATIGQYSYDGDGRRVKKYVPGTGETTIFVYDAAGKQIAEYSTVVADSSSAKVSYLTNDHLGSPRINTDVAGTVTARHDYHPFGENVTASRSSHTEYTPDSVRKQFTGYERDGETDLDFAQARYFNSGFGRFSSPDNFLNDTHTNNPQSWNLYLYAGNNPLRFVDPDGQVKRDKDGNIIFDIKNKDVVRQYFKKEATINGQNLTLIVTGKVNAGTIYADDGTPIEADQSTGALTATVTDDQGNVIYAGSVDSAPNTNGALTGWNNETDCHGNSFADGKFWINNKDVPALMKGDGYDIGNPSTSPTAGSIGIYSTDGTLRSTGPGEDDTTVRHSVTVIDPGQQGEMLPWADKTSGRDELNPSSPTTVESKAGVTPRTQTSPAAAWRQPNAVLLYYSKKVKQ